MSDLPIIYLDSNATSFIKHPNQFRRPNFNYNIRANKDVELDELHQSISSKIESHFKTPPKATTILTLGATDSFNIIATQIFCKYKSLDKVLNVLDLTIHNSAFMTMFPFMDGKPDFITINNYNFYLQTSYDPKFKPELLNICFNPLSSFFVKNPCGYEIKLFIDSLRHKEHLGKINNIIIDLSQYISWEKDLSWINEIIDALSYTEYNIFVAFGFHKKLGMQPGGGVLLHWTNIFKKDENSNKLIKDKLYRHTLGGTGTEDVHIYNQSFFPAGTYDITTFLQFEKLLTNIPPSTTTLLDKYHVDNFGHTTHYISEYIDDFLYTQGIENLCYPEEPFTYLYGHVEGPDYLFNKIDDFVKQEFGGQLVARTGKFCSNYFFLDRSDPEKLGFLRLS